MWRRQLLWIGMALGNTGYLERRSMNSLVRTRVCPRAPKPKTISRILKDVHRLNGSGKSGGIWNDLAEFNEFIRFFPEFFVSETRGAGTNTYFLSDEGIRFRNQLREQINTLIHTLNTLPFPEGDSWANLERNEDE